MTDSLRTIEGVAAAVRARMVAQYPRGLYGTCIEASDLISKELCAAGIFAEPIEGWCCYDDPCYGTDRSFDEHTWVVARIGDQEIFVDVTLDQFQGGMNDKIEPVVIGEMPDFLVLDRPVHLLRECE